MGTFRFLLAVIVAVEHFGGVAGHRGAYSGMIAVQSFYMVSGFLIGMILDRKYDTGTTRGLWLFYSNRALRILLPYWVFLAGIVALALPLGSPGGLGHLMQEWPAMDIPARAYFAVANLLIVGQEWVMWLTYDAGHMYWTTGSGGAAARFLIIPQAWSLSLELMFYALAPLLVRAPTLWLLGYIVVAHSVRHGFAAGGLDGGFAYRFLPIEVGLFMGGLLAYRLYAVAHPLFTLRASLAVAALPIAAAALMPFWPRWEDARFFILVGLTLPALFHVSQTLVVDRFLGELSYPIYLSHLAVLMFGEQIARYVGASVAPGYVLLVVTVLLSVGYVLWIDAPIERWRQRRAPRLVAPARI